MDGLVVVDLLTPFFWCWWMKI